MVIWAVRSTTGISFSAGNNLLMLGGFVICLQHCRIRLISKEK